MAASSAGPMSSASLPSKPVSLVSSQRTVIVSDVRPTLRSVVQNVLSPSSNLPASSLTPQTISSAEAAAAPDPRAAADTRSAASRRVIEDPCQFVGFPALPLQYRFERVDQLGGAVPYRVVRGKPRFGLGFCDRVPGGSVVEE